MLFIILFAQKQEKRIKNTETYNKIVSNLPYWLDANVTDFRFYFVKKLWWSIGNRDKAWERCQLPGYWSIKGMEYAFTCQEHLCGLLTDAYQKFWNNQYFIEGIQFVILKLRFV